MLEKINNIGKDEPLVSIIVPVYNVERFLPACIDSILQQTYRHIEIILVDDGSSDKCYDICEEYKKRDERIKVIHKENAGLGLARNSGIEVATGELVGFVDSDDVVLPQMYEILVKCIMMYDADIAACTRLQIAENENTPTTLLDVGKELNKAEAFTGKTATKELLQSHTKFKNAVWEKLYRKELFEYAQFKSVYAEDFEITYKLFYNSKKIVYIPLKLYGYRLREGSIMLSSWNDHKDDMVYDHDKKCMQFFLDKGEDELYASAVYWHFNWGIENYRRLEGQDKKYRKRLKMEMIPYAKVKTIFKTDYPIRRKFEFLIFSHCPELHYRVCNFVRIIKGIRKVRK